ncbi:MAG TPA: transglutaminase domain-containing protein, partial [Candidatus Dormibacteraeota bacterium]
MLTGAGIPRQRRLRLTERIRVEDVPSSAQILDLWYPLLGDDAGQRVLDVSIDLTGHPEVPLELGHDQDYGNAMIHLRVPPPSRAAIELRVSYLVVRSSGAPPQPGGGDGPCSGPLLARELAVLPGSGSTIEELRATVAAAAAAGDPLERAGLLRDAVAGVLRAPGGVPRYVELCRVAGIPTRLVTGLRAEAGGRMDEHLWAEVFVAQRGWIPVDPVCSLARRDRELAHLGLDHVSRARGQQLLLQPVQRGPRLAALAGPYAEVDGSPHPVCCVRRTRVEADPESTPPGAHVPDLETVLTEELELLPPPPRVHLPRGATFRPLAPDDWLCLVSRGRVRLSRMAPGGRTLELDELSAPAFFLVERARRGLAEAVEDTELRCLTRDAVLQLARRRPEFGFRLLETFGNRVVESEDRLEDLA